MTEDQARTRAAAAASTPSAPYTTTCVWEDTTPCPSPVDPWHALFCTWHASAYDDGRTSWEEFHAQEEAARQHAADAGYGALL